MKYARYEAHGETAYGVVEGDSVRQLSASPFEDHEVTDHVHRLSEVKLLAPTVPGKIVAIGQNYRSHLGGQEPPKTPEPFYKTTSALIGPGDPIVIPRLALDEGVTIQPEAELSVVMGKRCKGATRDDALSYVLGYTCGNDVSARSWQGNDLQWWRGKSSDTFAPVGPYIVSDVDSGNARLTCRINGKTVQDQMTSDLVHDVARIIEFVSSVVTLEPGDVIMTGTPGSPGDIHPGDTVEVEVEGVGVLSNPVVAEQ
jgi:2-keto-4-pentenoate hydratase/2-oxohepta-3-ene-1,7-dioic acid hydratase in catechol pathway